MRILVTDGPNRAALAVTRALGRRGHLVYVTSEKPYSLAGLSRYCAAEYIQAAGGPREVAESIAAVARDLDVDLVYACIDKTLTALHTTEPDLGPAAMPPPSRRQYLQASDKVWLFQACRRLEIPVPEGECVEGGRLPDRAAMERWGSEWVVRSGLSWRHDGDRWIQGKAALVDGWEELEALVRNEPSLGYPYLVQRRLRGDGCGLFVLAREGRLLEVFSHRRLREKPPWGGVSTLCESVAPPEDLLEPARRFVEAERWSGLAMLEFKRDGENGVPHLLEINARPWGSMQLAHAAGVSFAADLLDGEASGNGKLPGYREGIRLRWWWGDVDHFFIGEKSRGGGSASIRFRSIARVLRAGPWPEAWDTFQRDDPLPFAGETMTWIGG